MPCDQPNNARNAHDVSAAALAADAQNAGREGAPATHPDFDRLARTIWRLRQPTAARGTASRRMSPSGRT